ncbi:MAG: hypothetical protein HY075_08185 [Deltaproteobacteria bacterium]|nr:hypothetical protein [Deltaproteobacteria bacterium]
MLQRLLFTALLSLFFAVTVLADVGPRTVNLGTQTQADVFARELVAKYEKEAADKHVKPEELDPILIVHVGNYPPKRLQWILMHLEAAKIPVELDLITADEMEQQLKEQHEKATTDAIHLDYDRDSSEKHKRALGEVLKDSLLRTKQLFGLPNGITLWVKLKRSKGLKYAEAGLATLNAAISGASIAYSFYLNGQVEGVEPNHPLRAGLALAVWTWYTLYEGRRFGEIMTQAKVIKEESHGVFKPKASRLFTYAASMVRSLVTNAVVVAGAFGPEAILDMSRAEHSLWNTTEAMFTRGWIDEWFSKRMPTLGDDGTIVVKEGQWSLGKWTVLNSLKDVVLAFGKNVHLLGLGNWMEHTYWVMGAIGIAKLVYDERLTIKNKALRIKSAIAGTNVVLCESLILGPKPATAAELPVPTR